VKLEREKIVQHALALLNEVGLDALTTRRLADSLGVKSPALYWHFRDKAALLNAMADAMLADADLHGAMQPGVAWQVWLAENARRFRLALLSYRDGAKVHAGSRPESASFAELDAQARALRDAGFSLQDSAHAGIVIGRFVVGWVLEEQADQDHEQREGSASPMQNFRSAAARYPALSAAIDSIANEEPDVAFEFGLQLLITGLEARRRS
jgi:TetR/AcrR family tetracycline transcriptional repressor